jgi:hypothetical protein
MSDKSCKDDAMREAAGFSSEDEKEVRLDSVVVN